MAFNNGIVASISMEVVELVIVSNTHCNLRSHRLILTYIMLVCVNLDKDLSQPRLATLALAALALGATPAQPRSLSSSH